MPPTTSDASHLASQAEVKALERPGPLPPKAPPSAVWRPPLEDPVQEREVDVVLDVKGKAGQAHQPPAVTLGFREAKRPVVMPVENVGEEEEDRPEPEPEQEKECDSQRECRRCSVCTAIVVLLWLGGITFVLVMRNNFEEPVCLSEEARLAKGEEEPGTCEACGEGTILLPLGGEWEKSQSKALRAVLFFLALGWCFLGVAIICDQFMAAIEEITSTQRVCWVKVHGGARHKFHVKMWNDTVANLTLMALGSSAPEILLSIIELTNNKFYAGKLGPSTIVGSAAFNLLAISAVCVGAIPAPEVRAIEQTGVFAVTACLSVLAYVWIVYILQYHTPDKVDIAEACLTFAMFPVLVISAFVADRGPWCLCPSRKDSRKDDQALEQEAERIRSQYGKQVSLGSIKMLMEAQARGTSMQKSNSKAQYRKNIMKTLIGSQQVKDGNECDICFGFKERKQLVLECAGHIEISVVASRYPGCVVQMRYFTRDGKAKEGLRYHRTEGTLRFEARDLEKTFQVPIIDNEVWEAEEDFEILLCDLDVVPSSAGNRNSNRYRISNDWTQVLILNDDEPGTLGFTVEEVMACEGVTSVTLTASRINGTCGHVTVHYETVDDTAIAGVDYAAQKGVLQFSDGQELASMHVPILKASSQQELRRFRVVLKDPSPHGVKFDPLTDGGEDGACCEVILPSSKTKGGKCIGYFASRCCSLHRFCVNMRLWREQFHSAFYCRGSPEEQQSASPFDWLMHGVSLFWKVLFAVVPPASMGGGWACFILALIMIGALTAVVGDMASLLGCCISCPDDITAITLVALGTSLPDTFASRSAALHDATADNSIGNITGSNSVNVFLGLGLPWTIGAFYWKSQGRTADWDKHRYDGKTYAEQFGSHDKYPDGGFMMPAGSLSFSVTVFVMCALTCIVLLVMRRRRYGGELGGPKCAQNRDSILLLCLWFIYCGCSIVQSLTSSN